MLSRSLRAVALMLLGLALLGCKEVLYSELTESHANEMVAVLGAYEVDASRNRDKDGLYSIMVKGDDVAASVAILKGHGLPRATFATMGDVFAGESVVGTPFEERARYMYALSEELSHTVAQIQGVRSARVHIVLPESERFARESPASSASVVVFHETEFQPSAFTSTIKTIVSHGTPNLEYQDVAVAFFSTDEISFIQNKSDPVPGAANATEVSGPAQPNAYRVSDSPSHKSDLRLIAIPLTIMFAIVLLSALIIRNLYRRALIFRGQRINDRYATFASDATDGL